jgi:hypothetical protein
MVQALASDLELAKLTSLLVAAHCRSQHVEANKLPDLIASVNEILRAQYTSVGQVTSANAPIHRSRRRGRLQTQGKHPRATGVAEHTGDTLPHAVVRAASEPGRFSVARKGNVLYPSAFRTVGDSAGAPARPDMGQARTGSVGRSSTTTEASEARVPPRPPS